MAVREPLIASCVAGRVVGDPTVLVPWWISGWRASEPFFAPFFESGSHFTILRTIGILMIAAGLPMLLDSFTRFALQGLGTPAPIMPTKHLVVSGLYRYVRNPMYVGVVALILGQALLLGNLRLLEYGLLVWLLFHLFVLLYEEPHLKQKFGAEYTQYCEKVGRWLPRFR